MQSPASALVLSRNQVAQLAGLSVRTIERLDAIGVLRGFRPGGRRAVRYHRNEVLRWIADGCPLRPRR
jgi:excisionase family DNA binding protein